MDKNSNKGNLDGLKAISVNVGDRLLKDFERVLEELHQHTHKGYTDEDLCNIEKDYNESN